MELELFTTEQLANLLHITVSAVYKMVQKGEIDF